jgi:hypothetical protein
MSDEWPRGWEEHRADQRRWIAEHSTPEQRLKWLEQTMLLFKEQIIARHKREGEEEIMRWLAYEARAK